MKEGFYIGQTVYLDLPDSECVGKIRMHTTDYNGVTYTVMWNDGDTTDVYPEEITAEKPDVVA